MHTHTHTHTHSSTRIKKNSKKTNKSKTPKPHQWGETLLFLQLWLKPEKQRTVLLHDFPLMITCRVPRMTLNMHYTGDCWKYQSAKCIRKYIAMIYKALLLAWWQIVILSIAYLATYNCIRILFDGIYIYVLIGAPTVCVWIYWWHEGQRQDKLASLVVGTLKL